MVDKALRWYEGYGDYGAVEKQFDSNEEWVFYQWCLEALEAKVLSEFAYHTETFLLTPSYKLPMANGKNFTLRPHKYTPDFYLWFDEEMDDKYKEMVSHLYTYAWMGSHIDVKGKFNRHGGDRVFALNQKMLMKEHNVPVHKIVPQVFFKKAWVPESVLCGKRGTRLKRWDGCKTLQEVIDGLDTGSE